MTLSTWRRWCDVPNDCCTGWFDTPPESTSCEYWISVALHFEPNFGLLTLACFSMLIRMWRIFVIKNMSLLEWQLLWGVEKNDFKENVLCGCSICHGTLTLPFFWHGILECLFCTYNILYDSIVVISNSVIEYLGVFDDGFEILLRIFFKELEANVLVSKKQKVKK